jgi:hypothetical protein
VKIQSSEYPVDYEKRVIEKRSDADAVIEACKEKMGQTEILVCMSGKRLWSLCFNPKCPKKDDRRKHLEMQSMQPRSTGTSTQ